MFQGVFLALGAYHCIFMCLWGRCTHRHACSYLWACLYCWMCLQGSGCSVCSCEWVGLCVSAVCVCISLCVSTQHVSVHGGPTSLRKVSFLLVRVPAEVPLRKAAGFGPWRGGTKGVGGASPPRCPSHICKTQSCQEADSA